MNRQQLTRATGLGATLVCGALNTSHVLAAPDETAAPAPVANVANAALAANDLVTVNLPISNLPVEFMAYWLDPTRQRVPSQVQESYANKFPPMGELELLPRQPGNGNGPLDLKLIEGIESIAAITPRNTLRVRGTAAGTEELKRVVAKLDVALTQIEIEATFCHVSPKTLKALPLKFVTEKSLYLAPALATAPGNISALMNELIAAEKMRILTAPRVTTIDGLTARLVSRELAAIILPPQPGSPEKPMDSDPLWSPRLSLTHVETGLTCTPVVRDDIVKLAVNFMVNGRSINIQTNVRDGQSIAVLVPTEKPAADRTLIFLNARIIRRAGQDAAKSAAKAE